MFPAPLFRLFAAEFPDDAAGAEFAVETGVGAGLTVIQALLAVRHLHLLAQHTGVPIRVMAAFIHEFHGHIIAKVLTRDQAGLEIMNGDRG